jgi:hypothetical protein
MQIRDISPGWFWLPFSLVAGFILARYFSSAEFYDLYIGGDEYGAIELLTPVLLVPGIVFGILALRYWQQLPNFQSRLWIMLVTLGAFYMAGEEISWGQWFFMWDTPDSLMEINDQHETNLHNVSSWMDQKPRLLLELWALFGAIRSWYRFFKAEQENVGSTAYWFWPTRPLAWTGLLSALAMMPERMTDWWGIQPPFPFDIRAAEYQELVLAVFLSAFLASAWIRAKSLERKF